MSDNDLKIIFSELGEVKGMVNMGFASMRDRISDFDRKLEAIKAESKEEILYLKQKSRGYDNLRGQFKLMWVVMFCVFAAVVIPYFK